ncbi:BnaC03g23040D [Brassica napus]|nr:unnamed protein product [Brassica napus]CDY22494.1 BnaC03g23040D [Brassica napus]
MANSQPFLSDLNTSRGSPTVDMIFILYWQCLERSWISLFPDIEGLYLQNLLCFSLQANYGITRERKFPEHQGSYLMWGGNEIMAQELCSPSHQLISTNLSSYSMYVKQKHPHFKCN